MPVTGRSYAAREADLPESTLTSLFFEAIDRFGEAPAFQRFRDADSIENISYREALDIARRAAGGLTRPLPSLSRPLLPILASRETFAGRGLLGERAY